MLMSLMALVTAMPAQGPAHLTQVVEQAVPPVMWAAPASIGFGTALDATQLDAGSTLAGTFVYSPTAGAVLASGQQTLTTVFTPADANYKAATVQVPLTVRSATGATFEMGLMHPPPGEIVWKPGDTITLWFTPVGDFHQPIALACAATEGYHCSLDKSSLRPVDKALPLRVTISRDIAAGLRPLQVPFGPVPSLMVLALVLGRKRLRGAGVLLVLLIGIAGCGSARTATVTVTGKSLLETKSIVIHVVDTR